MAKILAYIKTEPALITNAVQALLGVIAVFGIGFTTDQTGAILAVTSAVLAAVTAAVTRPLTPSAFTGLATTAGVLIAAFGVHLGAGDVAAVNFLITTAFAMLTRAQVTPVASIKRPVPTQPTPVVPSAQ